MPKTDHGKNHCPWFGEEACVRTKIGASKVMGSRDCGGEKKPRLSGGTLSAWTSGPGVSWMETVVTQRGSTGAVEVNMSSVDTV